MELLKSAKQQFAYYRMLGEKAMAQTTDEGLFVQPDNESNSIAIIVNHLAGNMLSRWTDFMTTDGEKEWRNRDEEFENILDSREMLMNRWNAGWECLENALNSITTADLDKIIYIRNEGHNVSEAILRQLAHYPYHIGQMVFLAKMLSYGNWKSLSIPKNASSGYNQEKFSKEKGIRHFTDGEMGKS
jgi:hypothetical protein